MHLRIVPRRVWVFMGIGALAAVLAIVLWLNVAGGEKKLEHRIERLYSLDDPRFVQELGALLGPPMTEGNRYRALLNGDQIFPPMLGAIRAAQQTIDFESYIYWSGDIGREFAQALIERAKAGVKVHVLLDWVGSAKMDEQLVAEMANAGVQVRRYHPLNWLHLGRLNNRTHRKLLVVDGRIGFTGGVGIAPEWTGHAQDPEHWRDSHFEVAGPVVAQMQSVFLDNWIKVTGEVLHGPGYFPLLEAVGTGRAQMFSSSPAGGAESMAIMYQLAITAASRTIDLSAAYFVPDDLSLRVLADALKRGVKIRIVVPGEHIDSETTRLASRGGWGPLLSAGAEISEYGPTMYHCKVMIVDGLLVSVGSTNFDNRSFRLNDEATMNIVDAAFAKEQTAVFEADLANSKRVTYEAWLERPWKEKLGERFAAVVGSQL